MNGDEKRKNCKCKPFIREKRKGYCPDLSKCEYVITLSKIRRLREQPLRALAYPFPIETSATFAEPPTAPSLQSHTDFPSGTAIVSVGVPSDRPASKKEELEELLRPALELNAKEGTVAFTVAQDITGFHEFKDGTGCVLWGAGLLMIEVLSSLCQIHKAGVLAGRTVVDLGTGTGTGALAAVLAGAERVFATDRVTAMAKRNFARWRGLLAGRASLFKHSWGQTIERDFKQLALPAREGDAGGTVDLVMLADLLYYSWNHDPLFLTLSHVISYSPSCVVLMTYRQRDPEKEREFYARFAGKMRAHRIDPALLRGRARELETSDPTLQIVALLPVVRPDSADRCAWFRRLLKGWASPLEAGDTENRR